MNVSLIGNVEELLLARDTFLNSLLLKYLLKAQLRETMSMDDFGKIRISFIPLYFVLTVFPTFMSDK